MMARSNQGGSRNRERGGSQQGEQKYPATGAFDRISQSQGTYPSSENQQPRSYERTMAIWTIVLGASTIALFIATGVSAFFLWKTDTTIGQQVDAAHLQLRAYVGTSQLIGLPAIKDPKEVPQVVTNEAYLVTFKNYGATPARQAKGWVSVHWFQSGAEPDFSQPSQRLAENERVEATVLPGTEVTLRPVSSPKEDIDKVNAGAGRIFIWGRFDYHDIFFAEERRYVTFCVTVTFPQPNFALFAPYKTDCNTSN